MKTYKNQLLIFAGIVVVGLLLSWNRLFPAASVKPVENVDPSTLSGVLTTKAPWPANIGDLRARLQSIGLPALSAEGTVLHIHQHLDLFLDGQPIPVPAGIGIGGTFISPLHVHDETGIIHVESPTQQTFTLGQFFDVWGVRFTSDCIGGYCTDDTHTLRLFLNGELYKGDLRGLPLDAHQEIAIVYGTASDTPASIPSSFQFPAGE